MDAPGTAGSLHVSEHSLVSQNGHREPRASRRKGPNPSSWAWGRPRWPGQLLPEQECLGVGGTPWVPTGHQLTTGRGRARVQARLVRKATEPASWPQRPWAPRLLSGKGLRSLPQWGSPAQRAGSVRGGAFREGRGLPGGLADSAVSRGSAPEQAGSASAWLPSTSLAGALHPPGEAWGSRRALPFSFGRPSDP